MDLETSLEPQTLTGPASLYRDLAVSADGSCILRFRHDAWIVWDLEAGCERRKLEGHFDEITCSAVGQDGRHAVFLSSDHTMNVWDLKTGGLFRTFECISFSINDLAVSPDCRRAVTASHDKTLRVWDLESSEVLATFVADAALNCCIFAGPQSIVAGDDFGHVHLLKVEE